MFSEPEGSRFLDFLHLPLSPAVTVVQANRKVKNGS
jgi:hypothetical protein